MASGIFIVSSPAALTSLAPRTPQRHTSLASQLLYIYTVDGCSLKGNRRTEAFARATHFCNEDVVAWSAPHLHTRQLLSSALARSRRCAWSGEVRPTCSGGEAGMVLVEYSGIQ